MPSWIARCRAAGDVAVMGASSFPEEAVARRTRRHLLGPQPWRLCEGIVKRIAHQHRHPAGEQQCTTIALYKSVFAGDEKAEELGGLGEADRVRLGDRPERGDHAVVEQ